MQYGVQHAAQRARMSRLDWGYLHRVQMTGGLFMSVAIFKLSEIIDRGKL